MYNIKDDRSNHRAIRWITGAGDPFITRIIWYGLRTWPMIDAPESFVSSDLGIRTTIPMTCDIKSAIIEMAKNERRSRNNPCKLSPAIYNTFTYDRLSALSSLHSETNAARKTRCPHPKWHLNSQSTCATPPTYSSKVGRPGVSNL